MSMSLETVSKRMLAVLAAFAIGGCSGPVGDSGAPQLSPSNQATQVSGPVANARTFEAPTVELEATPVGPLPSEPRERHDDLSWIQSTEVPEQIRETTEGFFELLGKVVWPGRESDCETIHPDFLHDQYWIRTLWDTYHRLCGPFEELLSIEYKTSFAGEFALVKCRGQKSVRSLRLTYDEEDHTVTGCWLLPEPRGEQPALWTSASQCIAAGPGVRRLNEEAWSLSLDATVVEAGENPRELDCRFTFWRLDPPFASGLFNGQPRVQDRNLDIWSRVVLYRSGDTPRHERPNAERPNRHIVHNIEPGWYRVTAGVRGCPGYMVSDDIFLDGSKQTTEVAIPLHWARSVTVTLVDSETEEAVTDTTLELYLAGWAYRAWPSDSRDPPSRDWLASRYKADHFRIEEGRFVFEKIPVGPYTLGFSPPVDCRLFHKHSQRKQITLPLTEGPANRFILTTDTLRDYMNDNYDMYVSVDELREQIREGISLSTVALLGFCDRPEAQQVLTRVLHVERNETQLAAAKAIRWHDQLGQKACTAVNYALACANAGMTSHRDELDSVCVSLLRKAEGGSTKTSQRAAEILMTDGVRRLVVDLGSQFPALRRRAADQLGKQGKDAATAIPFLVEALEDDTYDFEPWSDSYSAYDFGTVGNAARAALRSLGAYDEQ